MKEYGLVIREIRLSKGISQKELYNNLISKSYAIEFEKGRHDLSLELLEQVLDALRITADEFLFIYNQYTIPETTTFWTLLAKASNENNLNDLFKLKKEIQTQATSDTKELFLALVEGRIHIVNHFLHFNKIDYTKIPAEQMAIVVQFLLKRESWTLFELLIFTNTLDYFSHDQRMIFKKNIYKLLKKYRNYDRGKEILQTLLINFSELCLKENELSTAKELLDQLNHLNTDLNSGLFRIIERFFRGILLILEGQILSGQKVCEKALNTLRYLEYEQIAKVYQAEWAILL
ncbi:helix-turn-helix domain-containing protein [Enterococcus wangshanyuanii]|uniref:Transcriptional regulator n=1 Tax=Enterococcus wangshanyuanii TaxID=2005703 RepID=A0ABQ1NGZ8_9ENTE|nr:Rgg/GadR/MutR family transcriptional regulator [Enterococcus wangshanyuanii]GGC76709.1 transcriptional regulator [Enterococcus wangshanyuanii]